MSLSSCYRSSGSDEEKISLSLPHLPRCNQSCDLIQLPCESGVSGFTLQTLHGCIVFGCIVEEFGQAFTFVEGLLKCLCILITENTSIFLCRHVADCITPHTVSLERDAPSLPIEQFWVRPKSLRPSMRSQSSCGAKGLSTPASVECYSLIFIGRGLVGA